MKSFLIIVLLLLLAAGSAYHFMPELFIPETEVIEKEFVAGIPDIFRARGGNLELAGFKSNETLRRKNIAKIPGTNYTIPGTRTTSMVQVPVTYRYHLQLSDPWKIEVVNHSCIIYAPHILPTLPPAIHTDEMLKVSREGLFAWDGEEEMDSLLTSITPTISGYAAKPEYINRVRNESRKTVAEFVKTWLLQRNVWGEEKIENIRVIFADESDIAPESLRPTLRYDVIPLE